MVAEAKRLKIMILLLGATGYIGAGLRPRTCNDAKANSFRSRASRWITPVSRSLLEFLRATKPAFVINAAGYTGKPNVDACELHKADTLQGNTLFPQTSRTGLRGGRDSVGPCFLRLHLFRCEN